MHENKHVQKVAKHSRISKFDCHMIFVICNVTVAYGYTFKYLIFLFHVNKIVSQLQSLSNLMLFPSHIENAA